ncbi:MAG: VWA domain-containing protein [Planctomycetes bacterium]|nr:VWA domain-containing protein [Planctomycetota bacterium]
MVAELVTAAVVLVAIGAEILHARRTRRLAALAFGPTRKPARWARAAPFCVVIASAAICWGLVTLLLIAPKIHEAEILADEEKMHVVLVLDVSPSMFLKDAGPQKDISRMKRASAVLDSFFTRVKVSQYRVSVVAFYTSAKPVVVDTSDMEVVRNILSELPMQYAFTAGETDLFAGLAATRDIVRAWKPNSTTVIVVSDGDTVPATGMPKMPASVKNVLVVGVGDPVSGKFINGRQSRQDTSMLRQVAARLGGVYHNGNERHLSTALLHKLTATDTKSTFERLTRREYALIACGVGAMVLAFWPLLLHYFGTAWRPGVLASGRKPGSSDRPIRPRSHDTVQSMRSEKASV